MVWNAHDVNNNAVLCGGLAARARTSRHDLTEVVRMMPRLLKMAQLRGALLWERLTLSRRMRPVHVRRPSSSSEAVGGWAARGCVGVCALVGWLDGCLEGVGSAGSWTAGGCAVGGWAIGCSTVGGWAVGA